MAKAKKRMAPVEAYLEPILKAAKLLGVRPHVGAVDQLTLVLAELANGFPGDVLKPVHALAILESGLTGSVEELAILETVWPGFSGVVRYTLTPTTLTWRWSSKHTGRYATITVPFPTVLPMEIKVMRFCDMDDLNNHGEECQAEGDDYNGDCHCEGFVEQEVSGTVNEWDNKIAKALAAWLERAVDGQVEPVTFPAEGAK